MSDEDESRPDPLARFGAILAEEQQDKAFMSGEHAWLGNEGMKAACKERGQGHLEFLAIARHVGDVEFTYGELVALSGDFYGSPQELFNEKPSRFPWLWEKNDISDLRKMFAEELEVIERQRAGESVSYPHRNVAMAWNAKNYVELALDNNDHFAWHNLKAYCTYHGEALSLAQSARQTGNDMEWRRALFTNAFADHFLTDSFAAGHVRVPRAQIREWAKGDDKLAGAISKLLHDQDGHHKSFHAHGEPADPDEGLRVTNSLGDDWRTRCDGQLFISPWRESTELEDQAPQVRHPALAVKASFRELLDAYHDGKLPDGVFAGTQYVPFPHPDEPPLIEKFSKDMSDDDVDNLIKSVAWYAKIPWIGGQAITDERLRRFLNSLPELMQQFRANVVSDRDANSELARRLPPAYLEALANLR